MKKDEGELIIEDNTIYEIDLDCKKNCHKEKESQQSSYHIHKQDESNSKA